MARVGSRGAQVSLEMYILRTVNAHVARKVSLKAFFDTDEAYLVVDEAYLVRQLRMSFLGHF